MIFVRLMPLGHNQKRTLIFQFCAAASFLFSWLFEKNYPVVANLLLLAFAACIPISIFFGYRAMKLDRVEDEQELLARIRQNGKAGGSGVDWDSLWRGKRR
jgi:hypothetical protein